MDIKLQLLPMTLNFLVCLRQNSLIVASADLCVCVCVYVTNIQGGARVGLQLWVCETQFILVLLLIIVSFSIWTTVNLFLPHPIYTYLYTYKIQI